MFLQDIEIKGNMKEEPHYEDIKEEIPHSEIVFTTSLIVKVKQS